MKERAARNRTLRIDNDDYKRLLPRLVSKEHLCHFTANKDDLAQRLVDTTICANLFDIIDSLPSAIADLIIIDPPYNLSKDFGIIKFKATDNADYLDYLRSWFGRILRVLKPSGSVYLCGDWRSTSTLQTLLDEHMHILNRITWQREKGRGAMHNWKNAMEDIWFAVKDPHNYYFNAEAVKMRRRVLAPYRVDGRPKDWEDCDEGKFRMTYPSNFMDDISVPYWSMRENTDHPTQKPEKLIAKLILASSPEGGVVFDPFLGSGTSSVVARKLGRHYIGVEINEEYCIWAERRLELASTDPSIQGYENGIFYERNTQPSHKTL